MAQTIIIGHGPDHVDSGLGEWIDKFDYVIRLGYYWWQQKEAHVKDYGTKTSFHVVPVHGRSCLEEQHNPPMPDYHLWLTHSFINRGAFWHPVGLWERDLLIQYKKFKPVICYYPLYYWNQYFKRNYNPRLGGFSKGVQAIILACHYLHPNQLFLAGFDNLWRGTAANYVTMAETKPSEIQGDARHAVMMVDEILTGHDWDAQGDLVADVAQMYGVQLRFVIKKGKTRQVHIIDDPESQLKEDCRLDPSEGRE